MTLLLHVIGIFDVPSYNFGSWMTPSGYRGENMRHANELGAGLAGAHHCLLFVVRSKI